MYSNVANAPPIQQQQQSHPHPPPSLLSTGGGAGGGGNELGSISSAPSASPSQVADAVPTSQSTDSQAANLVFDNRSAFTSDLLRHDFPSSSAAISEISSLNNSVSSYFEHTSQFAPPALHSVAAATATNNHSAVSLSVSAPSTDGGLASSESLFQQLSSASSRVDNNIQQLGEQHGCSSHAASLYFQVKLHLLKICCIIKQNVRRIWSN